MQANCESVSIDTQNTIEIICECGRHITSKEQVLGIVGKTRDEFNDLNFETIASDYLSDIVCDNCRGNYSYCDSCERLIYCDNITYTENDTCYCDNCSENYFYCEGCDRYYDTNEVCSYNRGDYNEYYICENCRQEEERENNNVIQGYHSHRNIEFLKLENENTELYFGTELEIQNKQNTKDNDSVAKEVKDRLKNKVFCEYDSSIDNGFEIISQPFTYNYLIKNKKIVKSTMEYLQECGFVSDMAYNNCCGFHIHISKNAFGNTENEIDINVNKLILFFETYKEQIIKIARRNGNHYASFISDNNQNKYECLSLDYIKKDKEQNYNRYKVVNTTNANTIEIRIFKGTLNFETYMASIEFIYNLMQIILSNDTEKITFSKVVNFGNTEYLKKYIKLRQVKYDYRTLHDYTNYLNILKSKGEKLKGKLSNKLIELANVCGDFLKDLITSENYIKMIKDNCYGNSYIENITQKIRNMFCTYENYSNCDYDRLKNEIEYQLQDIERLTNTTSLSYGVDNIKVINKINEIRGLK